MHMTTYRTSFILCLLLVSISACSSASLPVVIKGVATSEIILTSYATAREEQAAHVLQRHVELITGTRIPIVTGATSAKKTHIWIGQAALDKKGDLETITLAGEGHALLTEAPNVYIVGHKGKSVLYGVYSLLETHFGVRKYDAGPVSFKKRSDLVLPDHLHELFESPFIYRESFYPTSTNAEYLDWHKLHRFEDLWGVWGHSFFKFLPPETYFKAHPEYYASVNGKRQATQLCLSNAAVLQLTIAWFKEKIAANPDASYWSIAPMDGAGYCTCSLCSKADAEEGGPQGSLIRFVNAIAKEFPAQQFTTLAYGYTANAPRKTKPAKNVFIQLSTIDANRQLPLSSEPKSAAFRKQLQDWAGCTDNLFIWDYTTQFTAYLNPFPMYDTYQENMQYLSAHGVKGVFEQGGGSTFSDMAPLVSYLQAKLLWNPKADPFAIRKDFLNGYYGKAASFIDAYLNMLLKARDESHAILDIYGSPILSRTNYLSPQWIERYSELLDEAEASVEGSPLFSKRVEAVRLSLEYAVLQQSRSFGVYPHGYLEKLGSAYQVKTNWPARIKHFVFQAKEHGVQELAEGGASPDAYAAEWQEIFANPYLPSLLLGQQVELKGDYVLDYPANGPQTLTDGLVGNTDFSYNWLLFEGLDADAIIKLPLLANQSISLRFNYLIDPRHYIFSPLQVLIQASRDGKNFQTLKEQSLEENYTEGTKVQQKELTFQISSEMKYMRLILKCPNELPNWFSGARTRKPLIALDEITLK
ncbi:protein of unknown function [Olivibacter domesticus]|uniref:Glycosyl hydrolase family 67 N-terminus n=2 Tax=Olivibacter domesticus TaxID=407022 RepID=A0A1H7KZ10_OLID1|nr:protein of unknown function [Olivibacter domesticus]